MGEYEFWLGPEASNMGLGKRKLYGLPQSIGYMGYGSLQSRLYHLDYG